MQTSPRDHADLPHGSDDAAQAWARMCDLVLAKSRRAAVAEALGMSFHRAKVLRRIAARPEGQPLHELATELMIDKPSTSVIVRDLTDRGLVETRPHPRDGRSKLVSATSTGHEQAAVAQSILSVPPADFAALEPADVAELNRILGLLVPGWSLGRIGSEATRSQHVQEA